MKLSAVTASPDRVSGVWIKFDDEGCEFKIASTTRPEFNQALDRARRGIPAFQAQKSESAQRVYATALAEACIIDWKGVQNEDGSDMDCTPENKAKILKVPVLREFVSNAANDISLFQAEATAEDAAELKRGPGVVS